MARKVLGPKPGTEVPFTPEALGNAASDDPMRVVLLAPSESQKREHFAAVANNAVVSGDAITINFAAVDERKRLALAKFVLRVENYVDQDDVPIVDGEQLWLRGDNKISDDVANRIEALLLLTPEQRKNSEGLPDSRQQVTPHSAGTAEPAAPKETASAATATDPTATQPSSTPSPGLEASPGARWPGSDTT